MSLDVQESAALCNMELHLGRISDDTPDMADRVAEALFVNWTGRYLGQYAKDEEVRAYAENAKRFGRIFTETPRSTP